jgi:hypothetical protein
MHPVAKKLEFRDIIDKNTMIEKLRSSGKLPIKFIFHHTPNTISHKSYITLHSDCGAIKTQPSLD